MTHLSSKRQLIISYLCLMDLLFGHDPGEKRRGADPYSLNHILSVAHPFSGGKGVSNRVTRISAEVRGWEGKWRPRHTSNSGAPAWGGSPNLHQFSLVTFQLESLPSSDHPCPTPDWVLATIIGVSNSSQPLSQLQLHIYLSDNLCPSMPLRS